MELKKITKDLVTTNKEIKLLETKISASITALQNQLASLKDKDYELRKKIKQVMSESEIKKFENEMVTITYIAPTTRTTIDTKLLKEELPKIYQEYSKVSDVKDSVRITIKGV